jgi:hypothetical protein
VNLHPEIVKNNVLPDPYFLLLTTYMGKLKYVVNIDRFNGDEIWNQPLAAYHFDYPKPEDYEGADPSAPNVYRIKLNSKIWWADDSANPNDVTPEFQYQDNFPYFASRELQMEVWLDGPVVFDANGKITSSGNVIVTHEDRFYVGGEWLGAANNYGEGHPNLVWIPFSFLDASNPTLNPPSDATSNPYVDHNWLVKHLINQQDNNSGHTDCGTAPSGVAVPSPTPSSSPNGNPTGSPGGHPTSHPTGHPVGHPPTTTPVSEPTLIPAPGPTSGPTTTPGPLPTH